MFEKGKNVIISEVVFSYDLFQSLLAKFKGAFSRSSLSIEEAFKDLDDLDLIINTTMNKDSYKYYSLLPHKEKKEIENVLKQIIVFKGSRYGVFTDKLTDNQKLINSLFDAYFSYFVPYMYYYIVFDKDGNFDKRATFQNLDTLFINLPQRHTAYKKAYNMQMDNLNAFDYAMSIDELTVKDSITINSMVNYSNEDKVLGFKKTNNDVIGANFNTVDKTEVPFEMQKLFAEYKDDFGMVVPDINEHGISAEEKRRRIYNIFRKEAIFHIRFIRIHPFSDGNGRTGRIMLNHHLLKQGLAPVILSLAMSEEYKNCINNNDVEGLAKLLFYSSSLQLANWISEKTANTSLVPKKANNYQLAELVGYDEEIEEMKPKFNIKNFLF